MDLSAFQKKLADQLAAAEWQFARPGDEKAVYRIVAKEQPLSFALSHTSLFVHFLFAVPGVAEVKSSVSGERAKIDEKHYCMFTNLHADDRVLVKLQPHSVFTGIVMSMQALHRVFDSSFGQDPALVADFARSVKVQNLFNRKQVTPAMAVVIHQLFNNLPAGVVGQVFQRAKIIEFLSLYLAAGQDAKDSRQQCPFVLDAMELQRIEDAHDIITTRLVNPPSLKALARMVGTNEYKLKVGFKHVYGKSVYAYLTDYRMDEARKLLMVEKPRINEVAARVGYANPSHFIAAYKKRFGVTPKQHLKSLAS